MIDPVGRSRRNVSSTTPSSVTAWTRRSMNKRPTGGYPIIARSTQPCRQRTPISRLCRKLEVETRKGFCSVSTRPGFQTVRQVTVLDCARTSPVVSAACEPISMPHSIVAAQVIDLKPSMDRIRRLIRRWSCSMRLFRYWLCRMRIGFSSRCDWSRSRLSPSQAIIASRFVWLPSMTMRSDRPGTISRG